MKGGSKTGKSPFRLRVNKSYGKARRTLQYNCQVRDMSMLFTEQRFKSLF